MVGVEVGVMAKEEVRELRRRWLLSALLIVAILIFTAGCGQLLPDPPVDAHGTIVLTLSRAADAEPGSLRTAFLSEVEPLGENAWPRSVEDVLAVLEGYRIGVKGEGVDVLKDAFFEEGEDEITIEMSIPVGDDYSVTVLALGALRVNRHNLLGAGRTTGVAVGADGPSFVEVMMEPYRYRFEAPEQVETGATIDIVYELKGPLLPYLTSSFAQGTASIRYSTDLPDVDFFGSSEIERREIVDDAHWVWEFTLSGQAEAGILYFQTVLHARDWEINSGDISIVAPSIALGEEVQTVQIGEGTAGMVIQPVW